MIRRLGRFAAATVASLALFGQAGCSDDSPGGDDGSSRSAGVTDAAATDAESGNQSAPADPAEGMSALCPDVDSDPAEAAELADCVFAAVQDHWSQAAEIYVPYSMEVDPPPGTLQDSGCESSLSYGASFYCVGSSIVVTQPMIDREYAGLGEDGPSGLAFIVGIEMAYAVLDLAGDPAYDQGELTTEAQGDLELKTACLTGAWAAQADADGHLDLESFRAVAEQVLTIETNYQPPGMGADDVYNVHSVPERMAAFDSGAPGDLTVCGLPA